jgi:hypothetical protein
VQISCFCVACNCTMHAPFSLPTKSRYCGAYSSYLSRVSVPLIVSLVVTSTWRLFSGPAAARLPPSEPSRAVHTATVSCCAHSKLCTLRSLLAHSSVRSDNSESVDTHSDSDAARPSALRTWRTNAAAAAAAAAAALPAPTPLTHASVRSFMCVRVACSRFTLARSSAWTPPAAPPLLPLAK